MFQTRGAVPSRQLFADLIRTGGPMQEHRVRRGAREDYYLSVPAHGWCGAKHHLPWWTYFGIAHLLDYPVSYDSMSRFADRTGALRKPQRGAKAGGQFINKTRLTIDGDLLREGSSEPSQTELAVRKLGFGLGERQIRRDLERGTEHEFEETELYRKVFEMADGLRPAPRALVPNIRLQSVKISRKLTTEWFARRVDDRYRRCLGSPAPAE
jgi:hypothetical protein